MGPIGLTLWCKALRSAEFSRAHVSCLSLTPVPAILPSHLAVVFTSMPQVDLERTQDELLDDVHQRIRKAKVDGGLVPPNPSKGKRPTAVPSLRKSCRQ